ncbi:MAG: helix-turn-helix domain-containing protein [Sphingobacteriales bacterium]|nr:MAG: helix-turn-helix domain-containing protein [Sphingobacteriales bacterium]
MEDNQNFYNDCYVREEPVDAFNSNLPVPFYHVLLFRGQGSVTVDFVEYDFSGSTALFTSPYQAIQFKAELEGDIRILVFHGDFYCIEYHKKVVACNGLLFNNIYSQPLVSLNDEQYQGINVLLDKLAGELDFTDSYSNAVVRSYLQLILALSSKIKMGYLAATNDEQLKHPVSRFRELLETHFKTERSPSFYAAALGIAPNTFTKQCISYFSRPPSQLIQERVILEAKKLIHLTYKSMKEIAAELHFDDENYFSRYFKKHAGVSASQFREKVGISIVADLSR